MHIKLLILLLFIFSCTKEKSTLSAGSENSKLLNKISGTYYATKLSFDGTPKELSDNGNRAIVKIFQSTSGLPNIEISNYWQTNTIYSYTTDITLNDRDNKTSIFIATKPVGYVIGNIVYIDYIESYGTHTQIEAQKK